MALLLQGLHPLHLLLRQQLGIVAVQPGLGGNIRRNGLSVAGEHNGLLHTHTVQPINGLPAVRFNNICKHNVAQELRVRAAVHGGAHQLRLCKGHTDLLHQLFIPGIVAHAVHYRRHAHTGVVLGVRHHAVIGKLTKGQANGLGDGVGRQPLAGGNNPQ